MTPTNHRLILLKKCSHKQRKQIKTAVNCQVADNLQESFLFALFAQKRKKREKRKLPRTPVKERVEKKIKRKEKEVHS